LNPKISVPQLDLEVFTIHVINSKYKSSLSYLLLQISQRDVLNTIERETSGDYEMGLYALSKLEEITRLLQILFMSHLILKY
jgi:hypothetical protein